MPNELAAVKRFKMQLLVVAGKATAAELAHNFVRTLHRIKTGLDGQTVPVFLKVYRASGGESTMVLTAPGRVEAWYLPGAALSILNFITDGIHSMRRMHGAHFRRQPYFARLISSNFESLSIQT